jgi:acyl-coenzyme A synthetase/AMP-(fatty) acid ligase
MKAGAVAVFPDDVDGAEQLLSALVRSQATALIAHQSTAALLEALTPATGVTLKIIVGWERDGWLDYDRRVSMASADFEPVSVKADDVAVMYAPASEREEIRFYRHDDATFHNEWLDAFRDGRSISIREE